MRFKKEISILVLFIAVLSLFASIMGLYPAQGNGQQEFTSIHGELVKIYGKGLYRNDSLSMASQGIAQDFVTLVLAVPLLLISLYLFRKGLLKGRLLLAGTIGYFLYTYTSYTFLCMYNPLFLIYVLLMSASLFAFILTMMSFDLGKICSCFNPKMPVKFIGGFLIFIAVIIGLMWLGRIVPPLLNGTAPQGLEYYTTLVIQAMDLGFVVPTAILSGVLIIKRKPFGYLLTSVVIVKGLSMGTALSAMIVGQILAGVHIGLAEMLIFPVVNLMFIYFLVLVMKNVKEPNARPISTGHIDVTQ